MLSRSFRRSLEVANRSPSTIGIYTISSHLAGGQADGLAGALPEPSLDKNDAAAAVTLANYVRPAPPRELWAFRVRIAGGDAPALTLERSMYCPPVSREGDVPFATRATARGSVVVAGGAPPIERLGLGSGVTVDPSSVVPVVALIAVDGSVVGGRVVQSTGSPDSDARMVQAMMRLRFDPAKLDGQPVQALFRSRGESPRP